MVGSIGGLIGLPFVGQYCASKFALDGLIESIRPELRPFGVEATVVHPGDFNTPITANRVVTSATTPGTPYFEAFQRAVDFYKKVETEARHPEVLARRIDRLIDQRSLPVRVVAGTALEVLGVLAKRSLPSRVFELGRAAAYGP
ncbi:MAG: SDR family NAD(P)-dependent oxidoreductase [Hyphomicrobiaceae bacterium]